MSIHRVKRFIAHLANAPGLSEVDPVLSESRIGTANCGEADAAAEIARAARGAHGPVKDCEYSAG